LLDLLSRRLTLRQASAELTHTERILAVARVVLALAALLAFRLDSRLFPASIAVGFLFLWYGAHSIALLVLTWFRRDVSPAFCVTVHLIDILWPGIISIFTNGPNSPFFVFFTFALLAAAFRWGLSETILTMLLAILVVTSEALLLTWSHLASIVGEPLEVSSLVIRTAYLTVFGLLIGYLAESEKRRRAEVMGASQLSSHARVDTGLKATLHDTMEAMLQLFGARQLLLVAHEEDSIRANLWKAEKTMHADEPIFTVRQLDHSALPDYLFDVSEQGAGWRRSGSESFMVIDDHGNSVRGLQLQLTSAFLAEYPFDILLATNVSVASDLSCRVFMFDPRIGGRAKTQLRVFHELCNRLAPAIYNVYLLRRLRSRAAAVERARVARELHDGVVQSLHALAFRMYALRTSAGLTSELQHDMLEIQEILQKEASNLRSLIHQLRPADFDPRHLLEFLAGMIERFRYDTGISAKFVCDVTEVSLPPRTCREIAGIVQEALANILKHSGAENVLVRLSSTPEFWVLSAEDDGRGFEFVGRFSHAELDNLRRGPLVIKQRTRALGGELTIDSKPGQGARLEVKIPKTGVAAVV
jgi:signal transduction histidine kinase